MLGIVGSTHFCVLGACWTCNPYETSALTAIRMKKGLADSDGGGQSGQPPFLRGSQDLTSDYSGFVLPKGYPYKGDLDTVIGRLVKISKVSHFPTFGTVEPRFNKNLSKCVLSLMLWYSPKKFSPAFYD